MTLNDWLKKSHRLHKTRRLISAVFLILLVTIPASAQTSDTGKTQNPKSQNPKSQIPKTDTLRSYPDSLVYSYSDPRPMGSHHKISWPRHFSLHLPTPLRSRYSFGKDAFGFLYDSSQILYIYIDYLDSNRSDSIWRVTDHTHIEELLLDRLNMINDEKKIDIDSHPFDARRETWILHRGSATILLYNIIPANRDTFLDAAQTFNFTP